ncbi:MAG: outer membrane protein assembly factor BamD [Bacteroidales bacterium]|nr:outer membrane protein assembly factor BamD [Bacteroidales bacterium]
MKKISIVILIAVLFAGVSCTSKYSKLLSGNDTVAKYNAAFEYFNAGKYIRAAELFESISVPTKGTRQEDTVLFYWGLSNYNFKDYVSAENNFNNFINTFPSSPFTLEAEYLRVDCMFKQTLRYELDQTPTYKAISAIDRFIVTHPGSEHERDCRDMLKVLSDRVDKKNFEAARLYYHMEDYLAAHYALKNVLKDDASNIYREDILYLIAMSGYKYAQNSVPERQHERFLNFIDDYYNFVSEYPESGYRNELDNLYKRVSKLIGKE